jgi:NhaP-type Na+/H+ or K+/H+ antiporter
LILGIFFGLLASLILKKVNMNEHPVGECIILQATAYLAYIFAEQFSFSGIITMFSCGFTLAHYAFFNISR